MTNLSNKSFAEFFKRRVKAFDYAFQGVKYMITTQPNAWIHLLATVCAVGLSFVLKLNALEWSLIVGVIALVWGAEAINTALEAVVDLVTEDKKPLAKVAKDCAAAGVLFASIGAAIVGFLIFLPKLINFFA